MSTSISTFDSTSARNALEDALATLEVELNDIMADSSPTSPQLSPPPYSESEISDLQLPSSLDPLEDPPTYSDSESEFDITFRPEPLPLLMPELSQYSITAQSTRSPPSRPLSPLSHPSPNASPGTPPTTSYRTTLSSATHQTANTITYLTLLHDGLAEILSVHFTPDIIPLSHLLHLLPATFHLQTSIKSFLQTLELLLSHVQPTDSHSKCWRCSLRRKDLATAILRSSEKMTEVVEEGCRILKVIHEVERGVEFEDEKRGVVLSTEPVLGELGGRIGRLEREMKAVLPRERWVGVRRWLGCC